MLPRRYRFLNWLLRKTGRQFYPQHFTWWSIVNGEIVKKSYPTGRYRLATRGEAGLPHDSSSIDRYLASIGKRPLFSRVKGKGKEFNNVTIH